MATDTTMFRRQVLAAVQEFYPMAKLDTWGNIVWVQPCNGLRVRFKVKQRAMRVESRPRGEWIGRESIPLRDATRWLADWRARMVNVRKGGAAA